MKSAHLLTSFVYDKQRLQHAGEAAEKLAVQFSYDAMAEELEGVLKVLIRAAGRHSVR